MLRIFLILALFWPQVILAEALESARVQLNHFTHELESLSADFQQSVSDANGDLIESSEGVMRLMRPDRFRWDYRGEFPQQIVADGERVWIYDIELEQVSVKPQSHMAADSPLTILVDPAALDQQFTASELGNYEGMALLELIPSRSQAEFERLLLGLADNQLQMMVLEDSFGQRTQINFIDMQRNSDVASEEFVFESPPGVDVIGNGLE